MKFTVILIGVIVAMFLVLKLSGSFGKKSMKSKPPTVKKVAAPAAAKAPAARQYKSATIIPGPSACEAARALEGKRLLADDVGTLPLADCTSPECSCTYERYDDRRSAEGDKRAPSSLSTDLYQASGNAERREKKGRRNTDIT